MANPQKRYEYLVKEHKRLHDLVEYMKNDSVSSEAMVKAKKRKLVAKEEMLKLQQELGILNES